MVFNESDSAMELNSLCQPVLRSQRSFAGRASPIALAWLRQAKHEVRSLERVKGIEPS